MLMVDLDSDAGAASPYACDRQNTHHELEELKCATRQISGASLVENSRTRAEKTMWELHLNCRHLIRDDVENGPF
jgi:hypothetical protein